MKKIKKKVVKKSKIDKEFEGIDSFPEYKGIPSANLQAHPTNPNILLDNLKGIAYFVFEDGRNTELIQLNRS